MNTRCRQCGWPYDIGADGLCPGCRKQIAKPVPVPSSIAGVPFKDMKQMDEPDRIAFIVDKLRSRPGKSVGVMVDVGPGHDDKGDRYIRLIRAALPAVKLLKRSPGPVAGTETIILTLPP